MTMADNTGYQQAIIAKKISIPGGYPLDINGELTSESGRLQAILLLEGHSNPDTTKYEIEGTFPQGATVDGKNTKKYDTGKCPIPVHVYPDEYESEWVPKNKGKLLQWLDTWNSPANGGLGVTPGNYNVWLTGVNININQEMTNGTNKLNMTEWYPSTITSSALGVNSGNHRDVLVTETFAELETIECDEIAFTTQNIPYHTGINGSTGYFTFWMTYDGGYIDIPGYESYNGSKVSYEKGLKSYALYHTATPLSVFEHDKLYGDCYPWGNAPTKGLWYPGAVESGQANGQSGYRMYDVSEGKTQPVYSNTYALTNRGSLTDVTGTNSAKAGTLGTWVVPYTSAILQLMGQLPRHHELNGTGNRFDDIKDFFLADADYPTRLLGHSVTPPGSVGNAWYSSPTNNRNISGISLMPNGKREGGEIGNPGIIPPANWVNSFNHSHFGVAAMFNMWKDNGTPAWFTLGLGNSKNLNRWNPADQDYTGGQVTPYNTANLVSIASNYNNTGHGSGIRYCRVKTVEERGYKLVVEGNDILMVDPTDIRQDMPIGMERGVALRYTNRENRKVLIKYDVLQAEAAQLMSSLIIEQ